jgi:hypothetical protein
MKKPTTLADLMSPGGKTCLARLGDDGEKFAIYMEDNFYRDEIDQLVKWLKEAKKVLENRRAS